MSKKTIDELQKSLKKQNMMVGVDANGKSIQYWCGLSVIGGDWGEIGNPPTDTGSQMTEQPDTGDQSDCR